ncbi:MAG: Ig-like domain-containing protein [Bacteroidales bacterium]|nr:Ig-like domain-containing protein [Bacteroidales bacterium]
MLCDAAGNVTIYLRTTTNDGSVSVELSAAEYENASVVNTPITGISLKSSTLIAVGGTETLTPTFTPAGSTPSVKWTSSDESVATVSSSGVVTGVARGTATITATVGPYSASCTVTVRRKVWHSASYTINLRTNNTNNSSISYTTSPQNVSFTHAPRGGNNNNYYRTMGERTWGTNYDGTYTVTAPTGGNYVEARIIGLSNAYNNNSTNTVTYKSGSTTLTGGSKAGWGTTNTNSTTEVTGYNAITVTFEFDRWGTNHQLNQLTVYYGWFEYE